MDSADSSSARADGFRSSQAAAIVVLVLLCSSLLVSVLSIVDPVVAAGAVAGPTVLALALLERLAATDGSTADHAAEDDEGDDSSVWNAIPSDQYDGRHAESGGLARGEQERALREFNGRPTNCPTSPRKVTHDAEPSNFDRTRPHDRPLLSAESNCHQSPLAALSSPSVPSRQSSISSSSASSIRCS